MLKVHELKPNGQQITVTEDNKKEYVKLYVNYRFMRGIEQQFLALQKGNFFFSVKFSEKVAFCARVMSMYFVAHAFMSF